MLNPDSQVWNPGASWQSPHPLQPLHVPNNKLGAQISKFGQLLPFQIQLDPVQFVKFAKQAPQPWPLNNQYIRPISNETLQEFYPASIDIMSSRWMHLQQCLPICSKQNDTVYSFESCSFRSSMNAQQQRDQCITRIFGFPFHHSTKETN